MLVLDNTDKETGTVLDNIRVFLEAGVDLVIEFQPVETVAHLLADRFSSAGIHVIAVDGLIPGTVFFGANNYQAGKLAGQTLGRFANERWGGRFDKVVLIGSSLMPLASKARTTGAKDGLEELVGALGEERIIRLDGQTHVEPSRAAAAAMLNGLAADTHLLISAFSDPSAVGARLPPRLPVRAAGQTFQCSPTARSSRATTAAPRAPCQSTPPAATDGSSGAKVTLVVVPDGRRWGGDHRTFAFIGMGVSVAIMLAVFGWLLSYSQEHREGSITPPGKPPWRPRHPSESALGMLHAGRQGLMSPYPLVVDTDGDGVEDLVAWKRGAPPRNTAGHEVAIHGNTFKE